VIGVAAAVRVGRSHRAATYLGHVGAGLVVVVLAAQSRGTSREVGLSPGQSATVPLWRGGALTFTYLAASRYPADNRIVAGALIEVRNGERRRGRLAPTQNQLVDIFGNDRSAPVGRAAVLSGIGEDAYAALVSVTGAADVAVLRLAVHPLITWLWVGILLTMAGGVLTLRSRTDGA
jgi:cytochrome c biogenesis factor